MSWKVTKTSYPDIRNGIVTSGLVLNLDAAQTASYPGSGTTWTDLSGNGNNGTLVNGPTFDSANGGSLVFDGTNDYVICNTNGLATGANVLHSLEMWVNFNAIQTGRWWLALIGQFGNGAEHWIGVSATSQQIGNWGEGSGQTSVNLLGNNQWINITSTFDGSTYSVYVNGSFGSSSPSTPQFNFTNTNFTISPLYGGEIPFNGKVASARIYNRALTSTEVTQNFNCLRMRYGI
jgi:hypothetical protein